MAWSTATTERAAWDVFVWYGGAAAHGRAAERHRHHEVVRRVRRRGLFAGIPWLVVLLAILVIYFYTHYAFASITAHVLAMFPPFVVLLVGLGVPPKLAVYSLLCLANLPAGLTHYGTTTGPILFGVGYVSFADWWRVGIHGLAGQHGDLAHDRLRLVESARLLVRRGEDGGCGGRRGNRKRSSLCAHTITLMLNGTPVVTGAYAAGVTPAARGGNARVNCYPDR